MVVSFCLHVTLNAVMDTVQAVQEVIFRCNGYSDLQIHMSLSPFLGIVPGYMVLYPRIPNSS
jgi:hypothetical protein